VEQVIEVDADILSIHMKILDALAA